MITVDERIELMDRNEGRLRKMTKEVVVLLQEEADRLDRWAVESEKGGWSTHQVQPMRERASAIRAKLIGWGF